MQGSAAYKSGQCMAQGTGKADWQLVFSDGTEPPSQAGTREDVVNKKLYFYRSGLTPNKFTLSVFLGCSLPPYTKVVEDNTRSKTPGPGSATSL